MIPDVNKKEWQEIIKGKINIKLSSFSLQMKINALSKQYKNGLINLDFAIKELHEMCKKYERIYMNDLNKIFNN
jgi:hypothetical protein